MASTWTYTPGGADSLSVIRLQLADTDFSNVGEGVPRAQQTALFSDQEYQSFLSIANGDVTVALIRALYAIANNRAIMAVAVTLGGGGSVDFGRLAAEIRAQAQALWDFYASQPAEAWAEVDQNAFTAQRIWWAQILRQGY